MNEIKKQQYYTNRMQLARVLSKKAKKLNEEARGLRVRAKLERTMAKKWMEENK